MIFVAGPTFTTAGMPYSRAIMLPSKHAPEVHNDADRVDKVRSPARIGEGRHENLARQDVIDTSLKNHAGRSRGQTWACTQSRELRGVGHPIVRIESAHNHRRRSDRQIPFVLGPTPRYRPAHIKPRPPRLYPLDLHDAEPLANAGTVY